MREIRVVAVTNPVPREDDPTRLIATDPVQIPESHYYVRRILDGELRVVAPAPAPTKKEQ